MSASIWGVYNGAAEAAAHAGAFTDSVLDPQFGIAWLSNGTLYALRPPRYDGSGNGQILTLQYHATTAAAKPVAARNLGQRLKDWFLNQMAVQGRMAILQSQADLALGKTIDGFVTAAYRRAVGKDRDDTKGMGIDVIAVGLSIVLLASGGAEVLGLVALAGGVAMLLMDGTAYVQELAGDDELAERTKDATFDFRLLAMAATLPDAFWNVGKVLAEGSKMMAEAARINTVVSRAAGDVARSSSAAGSATEALEASRAADRARRYAAIGERARLRAVAARTRLQMFLAEHAASRALIPPSLLLMAKEVQDDKSDDRRHAFNTMLQRMSFHVSSVHREPGQ